MALFSRTSWEERTYNRPSLDNHTGWTDTVLVRHLLMCLSRRTILSIVNTLIEIWIHFSDLEEQEVMNNWMFLNYSFLPCHHSPCRLGLVKMEIQEHLGRLHVTHLCSKFLSSLQILIKQSNLSETDKCTPWNFIALIIAGWYGLNLIGFLYTTLLWN